jgi:D-arabinose 1-dehydrogenase-like Zn-dependent alcohol dehydrogenase
MAPEVAAPLMCGGATVFRALHSFGVRPTDRVGVIGVGGLGHLAIQFAAKMGCEVVVLSGTESKREEAMRLGANEFVATKGRDKLDDVITKPLNHLLVTTSFPPDWNLLLPVMAPQATIFPLTVSADEMRIPYLALLRGELTIQGSLVAPRQVHKEMIRFAHLHGIKPIVETFPLSVDGITEAMDRLNSGNIRYRGVLAVGA